MSNSKRNGSPKNGHAAIAESTDASAAPVRRFKDLFYGTVTVGERGQIVIPAKARRDLEIETGDKLLIMGRTKKPGLMLCKIDALRELVTEYMEGLRLAELHVADDETLDGEGDIH